MATFVGPKVLPFAGRAARASRTRHVVRANTDRSKRAEPEAEPELQRVDSEKKASTSSATRAKPRAPRKSRDDRPDTSDLFGLFTHPALEMKTLFVSMQWPDVLLPSADMRSKEPSEWPTEERMKVLGRTIYYWPVLRHFLWRGKVNEQAETDGEEDGAREGARDLSQPQSVSAATPEVKAPKRKKSKKMLSREVDFSLSWPEVEAKVLKTVVASLDAGGVEAIASIETLYYILSQGNMGLAELLNYNSGLELEILQSLVRSDVHVKILSLLADPARVFSMPEPSHPNQESFRMRHYELFCKEYLGGVETGLETLHAEVELQEAAGPQPDADGVVPVVFKADMEKSLLVRLLVHGYLIAFMLMVWRTRGDRGETEEVADHVQEALRNMWHADEAMRAQEHSARREHSHAQRGQPHPDDLPHPPPHSPSASASAAVSEDQRLAEMRISAEPFGWLLQAAFGPPPRIRLRRANGAPIQSPPWARGARLLPARLNTAEMHKTWATAFSEFLSASARNRGWARRMTALPEFAPLLVKAITLDSVNPRRFVERLYPLVALYHVAAADERTVRQSYLLPDAMDGLPMPGEMPDDGGGVPLMVGTMSPEPEEIDEADLPPEELPEAVAEWLMNIFDSQFYARRNCSYFTQKGLQEMFKFRDDPVVGQPASAVAAAGGHTAIIALLRETAPAGMQGQRWQKQWVPLRGYAAATLALLSRVDELRPLLVSAGAVPALVEMLDEHHPFVLSELPFSVTALLGVLPLDVSASNNDGPWVKAGGQPLTLAEVAATALLAITGRATLFRMPQGHNRAGGSGQPGGAFYQDVPFAEFFLMQVTTHLSTFGTVGVRDIIESGLPLTDAQSSFIADTRDTNMGVIDMLTQDYKAAKAIVKAGAVVPLVHLVKEFDSDAARSCLRSLAVSPDVEVLIRDAGGEEEMDDRMSADGYSDGADMDGDMDGHNDDDDDDDGSDGGLPRAR